MNLDKRAKVFFVCSAAGLLAMIGIPLQNQTSTSVGLATDDSKVVPPNIEPKTPATAGLEISWLGPTEREQQRQRASRLIWGRNPFEGPRVEQLTKPEVEVTVAPAGPTARALALTGISISGVERYAVIEQQVVQVGDALLGGYTVIEIASGSVRLIRDDEELILALDEP